MSTKIAILVNGNARTNRLHPITPESVYAQLGFNVPVYITKKLDDVPVVLDKLLNENLDLLAISGGDGTIHHFLTHLLNLSNGRPIPKILILRGGTMNIAAGNLGSKRLPLLELRALKVFLNDPENSGGKSHVVTPLKIDGLKENQSLYGFLFAAGIAPRILEEYYKGESSPTRAVNVTTTILLESFISKKGESRFFKPVESSIEIDGTLYDEPNFKIAVATPLPKLLLWFSVFDESKGPLNGQFHFLVNSMKTSQIARNLWPLSRGTYDGPGQFKGIVKHVRFEKPGICTIDGELYGSESSTNPVQISPGPELEFLDLSKVRITKTSNRDVFISSEQWVRM